jgi:hypothetical protein
VQRLLVAFPLYRQVPVDWFFNWLKMDKESVAATVACDGAYLPLALMQMVKMALNDYDDWDRFVIFEQDMIPPVGGLARIADYDDDYDIVGSIYFKHEWPYHVNVCVQADYPNFSPLTAEAVKIMKENPALYEVHGVSTGFTSISRRVFEEWDPTVEMWMPQAPFIAHDMHFCHQARQQGFKVYVDSGIGCGHLTEMPIGYPHSQRELGIEEPLTWEEAFGHALEEGLASDEEKLKLMEDVGPGPSLTVTNPLDIVYKE